MPLTLCTHLYRLRYWNSRTALSLKILSHRNCAPTYTACGIETLSSQSPCLPLSWLCTHLYRLRYWNSSMLKNGGGRSLENCAPTYTACGIETLHWYQRSWSFHHCAPTYTACGIETNLDSSAGRCIVRALCTHLYRLRYWNASTRSDSDTGIPFNCAPTYTACGIETMPNQSRR